MTARAKRTSTKRINKMEQAYAFGLEARKHKGEIKQYWYEGITLKLGPDCRYTPDFLVQLADDTLELHEVKGHWRDDAKVKLRVCMEIYPFPVFVNGKAWAG